jgi:hypothetical protein
MFPIKELMIACKNGRLSDKELNKFAKSLTKNCNFPSASSNYIDSTDIIENELQDIESISEENDSMLELGTFED